MKNLFRFIRGATFCLCLIAAHHSLAAADLSKVENYSLNSTSTIQVRYFGYNSPTMAQFLEVKTRVETSFNKIMSYGFEPYLDSIKIGIGPKEAGYTDDIRELGWNVPVITPDASDDQIERRIMQFFKVEVVTSYATYFANQCPNLAEFFATQKRVEAVLEKFVNNGFTFIEKFEIGITPHADPNSVYERYETRHRLLYVPANITDNIIEEKFLNFVK